MELSDAVRHYAEHGFVIIPSYLEGEELRPAQDELPVLFPTPDEYFADVDPERNARFRNNQFGGIDPFPYLSAAWSLLGLSEPILTLAEVLLGTDNFRLYEAHNWAKYGGGVDYDQPLHRDYGNHDIVVPSDDAAYGAVEIFICIHDVPLDCGPTHVVSRQHAQDVPVWPTNIDRNEYPDVYAHEVAAAGPAGTVLAYRTDTLHRGSTMTDPTGARFLLKSSFRTRTDVWVDRLGLSDKVSFPNWYRFVDEASPRQLEVAGFPPRGHAYWTPQTFADTCRRYPGADLSVFDPGR